MALATVLTAAPAAALTRVDLAVVQANPAPGATLPPDLVFSDGRGAARPLREVIAGRPAVLILADYRCTQLCGPILAIAAHALSDSGLVAHRDFDLVAVGFDPDAGSADAEAMRVTQLAGYAELGRTAVLLTGAPDAVKRLQAALGYTAVRDDEAGRYAHPATVFVVTPGGAVSAMLDGLSLDGPTLRRAIIDAGEGRVGSLTERIHVLCYGLDPTSGRYTGTVQTALRLGAALMLAGFAAAAVYAVRARRSGGRAG